MTARLTQKRFQAILRLIREHGYPSDVSEIYEDVQAAFGVGAFDTESLVARVLALIDRGKA